MGYLRENLSREFKWRQVFLQYESSQDFYYSSWQRGRSLLPLLVARTLIFLLCLAIVIASVVLTVNMNYGGYWLIYMTHWGLLINTLAAGCGVYVSLRGYFGEPAESGFELPWYVKTYWVLHNAAVTMALLISIFYWAFLTDSAEGQEYAVDKVLDYFIHAVNSVAMLLLLLSGRQEFRVMHVLHALAFATIFLLFSLIYYAAGGTNGLGNDFIYPTMDWSRPGFSALNSVLTVIMIVLIHLLVVAVAAARDGLGRWWRGGSNKLSVSEGY
ncbi:protein rolling stone [Plutella xylostella]|uniref:protein rolling stone n=1 Tax=Plutella xylostella TaxID=51655 RepID=UPI0020331AAF|nr:protein rolling stone [Plutella xylostella]